MVAKDQIPPQGEEDFETEAPKSEAEHPILTNKEVEEIRAQARKEIADTRKRNAKSQFLEAEKARLLTEEGLTTGLGPKDQMVRITIDLSEYAANIVINHKVYWHGQTYTVPRHVAETLREIMFRTHLHQNEIDGKGLRSFYQRHRDTELSPVSGVKRAAKPPAEAA